jgi:hypothetical protein
MPNLKRKFAKKVTNILEDTSISEIQRAEDIVKFLDGVQKNSRVEFHKLLLSSSSHSRVYSAGGVGSGYSYTAEEISSVRDSVHMNDFRKRAYGVLWRKSLDEIAVVVASFMDTALDIIHRVAIIVEVLIGLRACISCQGSDSMIGDGAG